jgi:predicted phosphoribosyltransferase
MYFESRSAAGQLLAAQLVEKYRYENCAVVALSEGGVLVGEQIAAELHCILTMLVSEGIEVPGESLTMGAVSQAGNFTYNSEFSTGEIEEYASEFHGYLEDQKRQAFSRINRLLGDGGMISQDMLRERVVILVNDGFVDGAILAVALDYLKPVHILKLVVASPIATVPAIDQLHVAADELHVLDVKENFMGINHYFTDNTIPSREETIAKINQIVLNWQ